MHHMHWKTALLESCVFASFLFVLNLLFAARKHGSTGEQLNDLIADREQLVMTSY